MTILIYFLLFQCCCKLEARGRRSVAQNWHKSTVSNFLDEVPGKKKNMPVCFSLFDFGPCACQRLTFSCVQLHRHAVAASVVLGILTFLPFIKVIPFQLNMLLQVRETLFFLFHDLGNQGISHRFYRLSQYFFFTFHWVPHFFAQCLSNPLMPRRARRSERFSQKKMS